MGHRWGLFRKERLFILTQNELFLKMVRKLLFQGWGSKSRDGNEGWDYALSTIRPGRGVQVGLEGDVQQMEYSSEELGRVRGTWLTHLAGLC